jgi:hypothetical protein
MPARRCAAIAGGWSLIMVVANDMSARQQIFEHGRRNRAWKADD